MGAREYSQSKTLVVFAGPSIELAFDALQVKSLRRQEEWVGRDPIALCPVLGLMPGSPDRRVVVVETDDDHEVAVLAEGAVSIRTVPTDSVMPPPPESEPSVAKLLQGVVTDSERPTLVIEANSLISLPH